MHTLVPISFTVGKSIDLAYLADGQLFTCTVQSNDSKHTNLQHSHIFSDGSEIVLVISFDYNVYYY